MFILDYFYDSTFGKKQKKSGLLLNQCTEILSRTNWRSFCKVSKPLVKVLLLVDNDKPAMGYLYKAKDKAKEAIQSYYADKGGLGNANQMII